MKPFLFLLLVAGTASLPALDSVRLTVDGTPRTLLISVPKGAGPAPLLIAYHGAGGTAEAFARSTGFEKLWPEVVVVYPQGLTGGAGGPLNPNGKLAGWQTELGGDGDRDVAFFDQIVAEAGRRAAIDPGRVYVTGQSNGGGHVFLLWAARGPQIAGVAPCSAASSPSVVMRLEPKPFFMISGQNDETVPFARQQTVQSRLRPRIEAAGLPFQVLTHPGGHALPADGPKQIVAFFRSLVRE